jgi:peptidoglycan/xylan/chitin deacetylase (PgdA/CDA1 family)
MIRAKQAVLSAIGESPKFVRAPYGEFSKPLRLKELKERNWPGIVWSALSYIRDRPKVLQVYRTLSLKHIGWDVDSEDSHGNPPPEQVVKNLKKGVANALADGEPIVVLFHDTNPRTVKNLEHYIQALAEAVRGQGREVSFTTAKEQIDSIFSTRQDGS